MNAPWDWVERAGWIAGLVALPFGVVSGIAATRQSAPVPPSSTVTQARDSWRLVPVQACRPEQLGVHPTAILPGARSADPLPGYVVRDYDQRLRTQLCRASKNGGLVVVVGGSSTGKSRSLFEAVRELLDGWRILLADDANAVREATPVLPARTVVWLDDTPAVRYLAPGGLTRNDLSALVDSSRDTGPIVVVSMLWPGAYQRLNAVPQSSENPSGRHGDPWFHAREALALAGQPPLLVPDDFSQSERKRLAAIAAARHDQRLAGALVDDHYGVTQHLAGAPELIGHWKHGAVAHPYGAALITTAVDLRRLGIRQPLTASLLAATLPAYLTGEQRAEAPATWFDDALAYATSPLRGGVRALYPLPGLEIGTTSGYEVADYLQQFGALDRHYTIVPAMLWDVIAANITDLDDMARLAHSADERGLGEYAKPLLWRVHQHSESARWRLVELFVGEGREDRLREYAADGVTQAQWGLVLLLIKQDRFGEVLTNWRSPGPYDDAWWNLGELLHDRKCEDVLRQLSNAGHEEGHFFLVQLLQSERRETALDELAAAGDKEAQLCLAGLMGEQGRIDEAIEEYEDLFECDDDEVADEAIRAWGALLAAHGREAELREWAAEAEDPGLAHLYLANLLARQDRVDELRELAADRGATVWWQFTALLRRLGHVDELRRLAVDDPWKSAATDLMMLLEAMECEDELREMAAAGNRDAHQHLVDLLARLGREDELREMAAAGDQHARKQLVTLLARLGRDDEIRQMAAAGDPAASRHVRQ